MVLRRQCGTAQLSPVGPKRVLQELVDLLYDPSHSIVLPHALYKGQPLLQVDIYVYVYKRVDVSMAVICYASDIIQ